MRDAEAIQPGAHLGDLLLLPVALDAAGLQMADAGDGTGGDRGRQRWREDEA
jgi:hypothetical protein